MTVYIVIMYIILLQGLETLQRFQVKSITGELNIPSIADIMLQLGCTDSAIQ